MSPIFFDIETGGLSKSVSSILSLGTQRGTEPVSTTYADPTVTSRLYRWAEKNIWSRTVSQQTRGTEQELIESFIGILQKSPGEELRGWNIGYGRGDAGFDLPFMYQRAGKYGLTQKLTEALGDRPIRDIGREYSVALAQQVALAPADIQKTFDPDILASIKTYAQASWDATADIAREGVDPTLGRVSERMADRRFLISGWKQTQIHELMGLGTFGAHDVIEDVLAGGRLPDPAGVKFTPKQLTQFGRGSLESALVGQAKKFRSVPAKDLYEQLTVRAEAGGVTGFEETLKGIAQAAGGDFSDIVSGRGLRNPYKMGREFAEISTDRIGSPLLRFVAKHPVGIGLPIGIAALFAVDPLNWFSGKDDAYNTIEGLPHRGMAGSMRRMTTDFGSGYLGLPEILMGQVIDPRILEMRAEVIDVPSRRAELERSLSIKQKEAQEELGVFTSDDFTNQDLSFIKGINSRDSSMRAINLDRFRLGVEDADTLLLKRRGLSNIFADPIKVRLAGIDAPEVAGHSGDPLEDVRIFQEQLGGAEATDALSWMLDQGITTLAVSTGRKTYGRYLGVVASDDVNLNLELLRQGKVTALPFGPVEEDVLSRSEAFYAEQGARQAQSGLWAYKRYQALREANLNIGRVITHNAITRLDKLAANLNFGAFGSFIESFGNDRRPLTSEETRKARRMGRVLRRTHGPTRKRFSGGNGTYNTIEGLSSGRFAKDMRHAVTDFGSPVNLLKAATRAEKMYKSMMTKVARRRGIKASEMGFISDVGDIGLKSNTEYSLQVTAYHKTTGEVLFEVNRNFSMEGVELLSIDVGEKFQGLGLGRLFYKAEEGIFKKIGYVAGETITSPVVSPITARWQIAQYGAEIESVRALTSKSRAVKDVVGFETELLAKQVSLKEMPSVYMRGRFLSETEKKLSALEVAERIRRLRLQGLLHRSVQMTAGANSTGAARKHMNFINSSKK